LKFANVSVSGGTVTISWTGGTATLQQASSLTGKPTDWSDVSPQPTSNTYTVSGGTSGAKFYRLKQ
jgi:hypothetical protein